MTIEETEIRALREKIRDLQYQMGVLVADLKQNEELLNTEEGIITILRRWKNLKGEDNVGEETQSG